MTRDEQIIHYNVLKETLRNAHDAEVQARHAADEAGNALAKRLLADVPADAINRTIMLYGQECFVKDMRCRSWEPTRVRPLVLHRIANGTKWGKTESTANKVHWDFEAGDWKVEGLTCTR